MKSSMQPVWFIGLIVLALTVNMGISEWRTAHAVEVIPWRPDLPTAQAESRKAHRPVFAYFTATWCPPCKRMKSTTWADNSVKNAMEKFVPVKIDVDAQAALARDYGITAMPTFVLIAEDGQIMRRSTGGMQPEQMIDWLGK